MFQNTCHCCTILKKWARTREYRVTREDRRRRSLPLCFAARKVGLYQPWIWTATTLLKALAYNRHLKLRHGVWQGGKVWQGAILSAASLTILGVIFRQVLCGILRKVVLSLCDPLDRFEKRLHGNLPRNGSVNDTKLKEVFYSLLEDAYSGPGMELCLNLIQIWSCFVRFIRACFQSMKN